MLNSYIFACALCLVLPPAADAADLITKAPIRAADQVYSWSGFYIEGYGEYAANITNSTVAMPGVLSIDLSNVQKGPGFGGGLDLLYQGGGSSWVLGIRGQIGYDNLTGTGALNAGGVQVLSISQATNYKGNFNAILGYTLGDPRLLVYATGGLAFGGAKPNLSVGTLTAAASDTSVGWDVGVGLDYALGTNWVIGIEGGYTQLGTKSLTLGTLITSSTPLNFVSQNIHLMYKF